MAKTSSLAGIPNFRKFTLKLTFLAFIEAVASFVADPAEVSNGHILEQIINAAGVATSPAEQKYLKPHGHKQFAPHACLASI